MSFKSKVLFHTKFFLPTVSQKQAVNKKDSVETIALTRTEVVERPYQK